MSNGIQTLLAGAREALVAAAFLALTAPATHAQVVLYDDFSAARLDENKWVGRQLVDRTGGTGDLLEIQREITAAQALVLQTRVVGGRTVDAGLTAVENALVFRHSRALAEILFDVAVRKLEVAGCAPGPATEAGAGAVFSLFDDGLGDVVANIGLSRSSASGAAAGALDVTASLVHRTDEGDAILGVVGLGSASLGQQTRLRMRWDPARNRVRFQRDAEPLVAIEYTNPVLAGPRRPRKYLAARSSVADCGAAAASAVVVAAFDNVRVNPE